MKSRKREMEVLKWDSSGEPLCSPLHPLLPWSLLIMLNFLTQSQHKCYAFLVERIAHWTMEMSCEGLGNAVPETVKKVVSDVLLYGFCPFDIVLLSSSTFVVFLWDWNLHSRDLALSYSQLL